MCEDWGVFRNKLHLLLGNERRNKRGAVAVEFALVLLLLLLILFGTIEFGWAFFTKAVVTNASREGARLAVTPSATNDTVEEQVRSYLRNFFLTEANATIVISSDTPSPPSGEPVTVIVISSDPPSPPSGDPVTVTVTYEYAPLVGPLITSDPIWTIVAQATMRRE